jgi:hypothetical protein
VSAAGLRSTVSCSGERSELKQLTVERMLSVGEINWAAPTRDGCRTITLSDGRITWRRLFPRPRRPRPSPNGTKRSASSASARAAFENRKPQKAANNRSQEHVRPWK